MESSILEALKHATGTHHRSIEQNPLLAQIFKNEFGLKEYQALLERLYGFYRPLEKKIVMHGQWATFPICYAERLKTPLLEGDLLVLGVTQRLLDALPRCSDLPEIGSFARTLGCVYVLEGATLGGRLIASHLETSLGLSAGAGSAFYTAYGDRVGSMWKGFSSGLEAYAATHDLDLGAMTAAACDTFRRLDSWLAE